MVLGPSSCSASFLERGEGEGEERREERIQPGRGWIRLPCVPSASQQKFVES